MALNDLTTTTPSAGGKFLDPKPLKGKRLAAKPLSDGSTGYIKLAAFGIPGTGKTRAIRAFLECGMKVFVISTDVGGSGLGTVRLELNRANQAFLLDNIVEYEFSDYESLADFIADPSILDITAKDGTIQSIYQFDPDIVCWEGFSNWQNNMLRTYVLSMQPGTKQFSEARAEGMRAELQDWDSIKAGTNEKLDRFLKLHNKLTGKKWHKYVTCHEGEPRENPLTGETGRDPMISGSARKNIAAGFDLVIRMSKGAEGKNGKPSYVYEIESEKAMTKTRGFELKAKLPADMKALWEELIEQFFYCQVNKEETE